MATMRVVQVSRPGGPFETMERPIPEPSASQWVRIKVQACGICHSDSVTKEGLLPGIQYPRVPGHEVAGVIDAIGPGVLGWEPGEEGGSRFGTAATAGIATTAAAASFSPASAARSPESLSMAATANTCSPPPAVSPRAPADLAPADAAPLMCAGVTTFNALRNSGARPGDVVAVLGLGGPAISASAVRLEDGLDQTVGIARGKDKEPLARQLGRLGLYRQSGPGPPPPNSPSSVERRSSSRRRPAR